MHSNILRATRHAPDGASAHVLHWLGSLPARSSRAADAQACRRTLESLPPDLMRDTGLTPEDATGIATHQADLPFFLQSGFGRR